MRALSNDFQECRDVLFAIGDTTRQHIMLALIEAGCHPGMRVGDITAKTHLSRPAVSHHLKVLKDAKILSVYRTGTMNYYYLDPTHNALGKLRMMVDRVEMVLSVCGRKVNDD